MLPTLDLMLCNLARNNRDWWNISFFWTRLKEYFGFTKTSNVGHELAFLCDKNRGTICSNIYQGSRSRADGSQETLTITADELRELIRAYRLLLKPGKKGPTDTPAVESQMGTKPDLTDQAVNAANFKVARIHTKTNSHQLTRALSHVGRAQTTVVIPEKITFYCSALEALFSTSHMEITHQVAERAAVVRAASKTDRLDTYRAVKSCYSFRSKYIHGAPLKDEDESRLQGMCRELDTVVRECFHQVLEDGCLLEVLIKGGEQQVDDFMLQKLFG